MAPPRTRSSRLLAAAVVASVLLATTATEAVAIRVRAGATIQAQARFDDQGRLELRGQITDDARRPIAGVEVEVGASGKTPHGAEACGGSKLRRAQTPALVILGADDAGELCANFTTPPPSGRLRLHFRGDPYHGAAELDLAFDRTSTQKIATELRFEPRPQVIDLEGADVLVSGVLAMRKSAHATRAGLRIELQDDSGRSLGWAQSNQDGKVRYELRSAALGAPGYGALTLDFAGNEQLAPAKDTQPVTRRATVRLELAEPVRAATSGEPAWVVLKVEAAGGVVQSGIVEAAFAGCGVSSVPVREGRAELPVQLETAEDQTEVAFRYLASSPWYQPGPPLAVVIPTTSPSIVFRVLLALAVVVVAAWVTHSWRRARRPRREEDQPLPRRAGIHVVPQRRRRRRRQWDGLVLDAHDGTPLAGARLSVSTPATEADQSSAIHHQCSTDDQGRFSFELAEAVGDAAEITVRLSTHSSERKRLPPPGTLHVALMTRRRTVLRRLVAWARARGAPFAASPEPTPAQVRSAGKSEPEVADWAAAVEAVAFGPDEVDEATERDLAQAEPSRAPTDDASTPP